MSQTNLDAENQETWKLDEFESFHERLFVGLILLHTKEHLCVIYIYVVRKACSDSLCGAIEFSKELVERDLNNTEMNLRRRKRSV